MGGATLCLIDTLLVSEGCVACVYMSSQFTKLLINISKH